MSPALPAVAGAIPLIVGVTGHRDLLDAHLPHLERAFAAELNELRQKYPHSSLVLLSPLAEGADRLAARVALAAGIRLIVPLPMPQTLYKDDFETASSLTEFRDLLGRAEARIDLPLLPGTSEAAIRHAGHARDREYAKVGAYVANYSQVMVAFWDGLDAKEARHIGGTARVVELRLKGAPYIARSSRLTPLDSGAVVHIVTPRVSNPTIINAFSRSILLPADRTAPSIDRLLRRMDLFNHDASRLGDGLSAATITSKAYVLHSDVSVIDEVIESLPTACAVVLEQYTVADALAGHYAKKTLSAWKHVFIGVGIAAVLVNLHTSLYQYTFFATGASVSRLDRLAAAPWALLCFLALSAFTAIWLHGRAKKGEYQNKHQDYRALAEALRVQFFWLVAGIAEPVVQQYLRKHRSDLEWIRSALFFERGVDECSGELDAVCWPEIVR